VLKFLPSLFLLLVFAAGGLAAPVERSVVQILTFSQQPVWDAPWRFDSVRRGTGTGFVIQGRRIMTNAHVVSWARQILLRRYQDPRLYVAQVRFIGHDCDLALLEVEDERFFEGLEALEFGGFPEVRSTVVTYGYPAGGEQISYTRGVVSRVEMQSYVHIGNRSFLGVQTDAAINPGNSGGPVIQEERVVGVAFQGISGLENTGFFIPPPVIDHFLEDVEDGTYDGFPQAGIRVVPMQNPAYREYLGLRDDESGARVDSILPIAATRDLLRLDDVILRVGEFDVGSDGNVSFAGNRVFAGIAFQSVQAGESVPLRVWRDQKELGISLPVSIYDGDRAAGNQYDVLPKYFVYGGLVFTPLSLDYLKTFGRDWRDAANSELIYELLYRPNEAPETVRPEPVVLASVLSHPVNANLRIAGRALIDQINGIRITRMEDVVRAFDSADRREHLLEFLPKQAVESLDRVGAEAANADILNTYGIPADRRL
jgi:S1-C subfamily serine protease